MCLSIVSSNVYANATISATPAIASLVNTQSLRRGLVATTTSNASQIITASWAQATAIDTVLIPIDTTADVLIEFYDAANLIGSLVYSAMLEKGVRLAAGVWRAGIDPFGAYAELYATYRPNYFSVPVMARSMRITITSPIATVKKIPLIFVGKCWRSALGASVGVALTLKDTTQMRRTRAGSLVRVGGGAKYRELSVDLPRLSDAERVALHDALSVNTFCALVDVFPSDTSTLREQMTLIGAIAEPAFIHNGSFHQTKLTIAEV